ncbi:MAG: hypothetical protein JKY37_22125, partial [Nannocystaceae bacterium]|nr:hypothetical protein [Nannocystaceae bacterium]
DDQHDAQTGALDGAADGAALTSDDGAVPTEPSDDTTTTAAADTSTSGQGDDRPSVPPVVLDLGTVPDAPMYEALGCQGIDFLFVVDNSGSMSAQQTQLLNSFPGFITGIEDSLENVDSYHVGVITSDNYAGNEPGCNSLGDLVTQTAGFNSSDAVCGPFADGLRYATDEDDLQSVFPCMAHVGASGSPIEQPVTATIAALDPARAVPGGCNEGFLREDAILVVVLVTDDPPYTFDMDDAHPNTDTTGWYDAVVAAKGGDVESIVVIGFVPWMDTTCNGGASPNLIGFISQFAGQGVLASICEPDYGPVFASTIATIQTTCDNFVPQG